MNCGSYDGLMLQVLLLISISGSSSSYPRALTVFNNELYFGANDLTDMNCGGIPNKLLSHIPDKIERQIFT